MSEEKDPVRPKPIEDTPVPPAPKVDESKPDLASVEYSRFRTGLSRHRTGLSEHRTQLSEYRTDLSSKRTRLSTNRTEMSMRRTGMSFQRTRMSADRTLMSVIRTSLSMIGFGFTIYQIFRKMFDAKMLQSAAPARHFGTALLALGCLLLVGGILYHLSFMNELRRERQSMRAAGLVHAQTGFPLSITLITALLLLVIGLFATASILFQIGPLG